MKEHNIFFLKDAIVTPETIIVSLKYIYLKYESFGYVLLKTSS
jgi:hypothetical protein